MRKTLMKRSLGFVMLMAALLCVSAPALAYPKWIGVKGKLSIVRNEKQKDKNANNYKQLKLVVTYKNNSRDKIITAIFNKTTSLNCSIYAVYIPAGYQYVKENGEVASCNVKGAKSDKVNKCELYPGQSISLAYYFNVTSFKKRNVFNTGNPYIKGNWKFGHDFQVSSKGI